MQMKEIKDTQFINSVSLHSMLKGEMFFYEGIYHQSHGSTVRLDVNGGDSSNIRDNFPK